MAVSTIRSHLADQIIYQSKFSQQWWERIYGPGKTAWRVVYNGVDLERYSPIGDGKIPEDTKRILLVEGSIAGGYEWGLETAVQMAESLGLLYDYKIELQVVGRVAESLQREISQKTHVKVSFTGEVPAHKIPEFDRSAHALYAADVNAACPNSVIEALACGLPVVATRVGGNLPITRVDFIDPVTTVAVGGGENIIIHRDGPVPVFFQDISARAEPFSVELGWVVIADEAIRGFEVYRRDGDGNEIALTHDLLAPTASSFIDRRVTPGRRYEYSVVALDEGGSMIRSRPVWATVPDVGVTLHQNTPNPFNPSTHIRFTLPARMHVTLGIFDVNGRRVATPVDGVRAAGTNQVVWDGRNSNGDPKIKLLANDICDCIGGRRMHPTRTVIGGFTMLPEKEELRKFKYRLQDVVDDLVQTAELFRQFTLPDFRRETEFVSLKGNGDYPFIGGDLVSTDGVVKKEHEYRLMTNEYMVGQSTSKWSKLSRASLAVGSLARLNNNFSFLHKTAMEVSLSFGLKPVNHNPFMNNIAQLVECVHVVMDSIDMINEMLDSECPETSRSASAERLVESATMTTS